MPSHVDNLKDCFVSKLRLWNFTIILPSQKDSPIKTISYTIAFHMIYFIRTKYAANMDTH